MRSKLAKIYGHAYAAWVVLVAGVCLSAGAAYMVAAQLEREARLTFETAASDARDSIESRINEYAEVLLGVRGLFMATDPVGRDAFKRYLDSLDLSRRYAGIQVIHYSRRISAAQRPAFEAAVRGDTSVDPRGYPGFRIRPEGERQEYVVAEYVEPMAGNERALGLDLGADAVRLAALERTRDSGQLTASGTIALGLDPKRHPGFAMRLAVYRRDAPIASLEQRREAFVGVVSASFVVIDLMRGVLSEPFLNALHVRIHDAGFVDAPGRLQPPTPESLMFDSDRLLGDALRAQPAASGGESPGMSSSSGLRVGGRLWNLYFSARQELGAPSDRWLPWAVLLVGVMISALLFGLIRTLATTGARAFALADRITEDLRRSEDTLRDSETRYGSVVAAIAEGVLLRDKDRRIVTCNASAERILGRTLEQMRGSAYFDPSWQVIREDGSEMPEAERPVNAAQRTGKLQSDKVMGLRKPDGSVLWLSMSAQPLVDESGAAPSGIVTTIVDITLRKQVELRQAMEHKVTRLLSETETLEQVMPRLIQNICDALGCACGAFRIWDEREQKITCAGTWSVPSAEVQEFMALSREPGTLPKAEGGLLGRVLASGEPTWIADVTREPSFRRAPLAAKAGLKGAFAFPIRFGNETLGIMEFFSRGSRAPDEVLMQSTRSIGSQIGQFMARRQAEERVRHLAHYDELSGLPNRAMFHQRVGHALAQARRNNEPLAILFIDLDRFKSINDTLGHDAGDRVLREIADRLRACLRESDTVGRLGGDEFVVLIEELPQPAHVAEVARKILAAVARPVAVDAQEFHLTASIGISNFPGDSEDMQGLMKNADIAMYRAKDQGKNNYQFYSAQMNVHTLERLALESGLRRALERDEFLLHYQPKLDIRSGRITGMEVLVRWQHPERGLVPPGLFIPLAEETGLIVPLGEWVLRTACGRNRSWQFQGMPPVRIAVNLSARQFSGETLVQDVARVLGETGLDPASLELEITESMVMRSPERAAKLLRELKSMGIHLSIDDFGTGYSSLSYLKRFPINSLKIDRSFVQNLPHDGDDAAITQAIIAMAHSLRIKVIAEGVETEAQLRFLRAHDCDEMQGYLFSRPVPEFEALRLLQDSVATSGGSGLMLARL